MRTFREAACRGFLADLAAHPARYDVGQLPALPFADGAFDLALVSYLLFAYERQFDYDFHRRAVLELMRVTRGEARLYPVVSFEAQRSEYIARFPEDPALAHLRFDVVPTDFEFLVNSNFYLRVTHREPTGA
jgi:ubiquinone/menaquinone biosynthesis C-methylase UbiE